jgi:hypothetical protein
MLQHLSHLWVFCNRYLFECCSDILIYARWSILIQPHTRRLVTLIAPLSWVGSRGFRMASCKAKRGVFYWLFPRRCFRVWERIGLDPQLTSARRQNSPTTIIIQEITDCECRLFCCKFAIPLTRQELLALFRARKLLPCKNCVGRNGSIPVSWTRLRVSQPKVTTMCNSRNNII